MTIAANSNKPNKVYNVNAVENILNPLYKSLKRLQVGKCVIESNEIAKSVEITADETLLYKRTQDSRISREELSLNGGGSVIRFSIPFVSTTSKNKFRVFCTESYTVLDINSAFENDFVMSGKFLRL